MLKIAKNKVLIKVLKDLEEKLGLYQEIKGDEGSLTGYDIDQYYMAPDQDIYQIRSPSLSYSQQELIDSIKYQEEGRPESHGLGISIPVPVEAAGWPPGIVEFILRTVVMAIDSVLDNTYDTKEIDNSVDNILRGKDQTDRPA